MGFLKKLLGIERQMALEAYRKGIHYYNEMDYVKAIPYLEQVLSEPKLANALEANLANFYCCRAYINVGITYFAKKENQKALNYFQNALRFNAEDTDLNYFIGICLNNIGDYEKAMDSFSKILKSEPWNIPTKLKMAIIFHNMKMWENAEEIHRSILDKNPGFADVHFHLGLSLMSQGKTDEAEKSFQRALEINPYYSDAQIKLGIIQICTGDLNNALDNFNQVIKRHPDYADVLYFIALAKEQQQDFQGAAQYLTRALAISPGYKNALVKLVIVYSHLGEITLAESTLKQGLEHYPMDNRLESCQKSLKLFDGRPSGAQEEMQMDLVKENLVKELRNEFHKDLDIMPNFSEIIAMFNSSKYIQQDTSITEFLVPFITEQISQNPTYPDLYNSLGTQLLLSKKYAEAENAFTKALELNPDYVTARINLMKTLHKTGKEKEALSHGNLLLEKNLPFPDVYQTLSEVFYSLKQYDNALLNAQRVIKLRPSMINAKLLIAQIYDAQGKKIDAIKMINEFLDEVKSTQKGDEAKELLKKLKQQNSSSIIGILF